MDEMIIEREGPIGTIAISNPGKLNAMTHDMWTAFPSLISELDGDAEIRVITVTGRGDQAFVSGADVSQFDKLRDTAERSRQYSGAVEAALLAPARCSKPVVAVIRGYCFGGGLALAAGCDVRIAADNASFRMPAARLGLGYPPSSLRRFVDIVGMSNTMDIFFSARRFNAFEAAAMAFANRVLPLADMDQHVRDYLTMIAEAAPLTVAAVKFAVQELMRDPGERDMARAEAMAKACFSSVDHREGREAFAQKRKPMFVGA